MVRRVYTYAPSINTIQLPAIIFMIGAVSAITFIVKLPVMPSIVIAVIVATVVAAASEDAVR